MSTITTLRRSDAEHEVAGSRIVLGSAMTKSVVAALSDEFSRRMLVSTVAEGKTVQDISVEQAVPVSTCYRRARELVEEGLLVVQRIVVTGDGKKYTVYRSSFKSIEMTSDFRGIAMSAELNDDVAVKFRQKWFCLSYPVER